jgi:hypothetical protein
MPTTTTTTTTTRTTTKQSLEPVELRSRLKIEILFSFNAALTHFSLEDLGLLALWLLSTWARGLLGTWAVGILGSWALGPN